MSGGVDSSVAAALLVREGYDVVGIFMKNWSEDEDPCTGTCSWKEERADALRVATKLGIPFETFDFEKEYRAAVVDYLCREYDAGRTPNPDVMCNKFVKFDLFLKRAKDLGADAIATGHYARVTTDERGVHHLLAGVDTNKDQSYFLHQLTQEQLGASMFPVGHLRKSEVRALAKEFGLPTAEKKDSQGICFIGQVDLREFLSKRIKSAPGPIMTTDGRQLGTHAGAASYTIGQRHGFGGGGGTAYYVTAKDVAANTITVGPKDDPALYSLAIAASNAHWISGVAPASLTCSARIRYRQPLQPCTVATDGVTARVVFAQPQFAASAGQFVVFYDGDDCLGGAVIESKE